jgi:hypothetical protein
MNFLFSECLSLLVFSGAIDENRGKINGFRAEKEKRWKVLRGYLESFSCYFKIIPFK